jgi:hypothetical protein
MPSLLLKLVEGRALRWHAASAIWQMTLLSKANRICMTASIQLVNKLITYPTQCDEIDICTKDEFRSGLSNKTSRLSLFPHDVRNGLGRHRFSPTIVFTIPSTRASSLSTSNYAATRDTKARRSHMGRLNDGRGPPRPPARRED